MVVVGGLSAAARWYGNAPFVSMMTSLLREGRPRKAVFINGVSYVADLGYRDLVEGWQASGEYPSRTCPPCPGRRTRRMPAGPAGPGRTEAVLPRALEEFGLTPANAIAYICGNPDMILAADAFAPRSGGFPEAQIKKEPYRPKGKEPRTLEQAGVAAPGRRLGTAEPGGRRRGIGPTGPTRRLCRRGHGCRVAEARP